MNKTYKAPQKIRQKYAGVKLPQLAPRSEWVTIEEMRDILHKENEEFFKDKKVQLQRKDEDR